jgi:cytochrome c oxidase cbb3-type subunit III
MKLRSRCGTICLVLGMFCWCACKREERGFRVEAPSANRIDTVQLTTLQPGPSSNEIFTLAYKTNPPANSSQPAKDKGKTSTKNEYEQNAYALSEGKRLFSSYNCSGCHANGGGGMGPALIDDKWIYGSQPDQIFATIVQGRPNGMPSFHGKVPDYQVWQIAAYVRSMSGLVPKDAAPGRNDDMQAGQPENSRKPEKPKDSSPPASKQ